MNIKNNIHGDDDSIVKRRMYPPILIAVFCLAFFLLSSKHKHEATPYVYPNLSHYPKMLPTDNPPTVEGVELGRHLFYDPILSRDSTISCSSCHRQEHAFSDGGNRFSTGAHSNPSKRNTPPLFNLVWYPHLHWDGEATSIEAQISLPITSHSEMDLDWPEAIRRIQRSDIYPEMFQAAFGDMRVDSVGIVRAIAQFERTLISHHSKYDQALKGKAYLNQQEYKGFELANDQVKGNCLHCHTTDANALGTTGKFSNNGLDGHQTAEAFEDWGRGQITRKEKDIGLFKIPSLRNVALTAPYMHDGRFNSLEEVLDFYHEDVQNSMNIDSKMGIHHQRKLNLNEEEKACIIAFLHTLTDSIFIQEPAFGNPFLEE